MGPRELVIWVAEVNSIGPDCSGGLRCRHRQAPLLRGSARNLSFGGRRCLSVADARGIGHSDSLYRISVDEFLAWERDVDRYCVPGLRTTRYQIYRNTQKPR